MSRATSVASSAFLVAQPGDIVVVDESRLVVEGCDADWWVGHVIHIVGGARDSSVNSIFQVVDIDTGTIKTINADLVKGILRPRNLDFCEQDIH